MSDISDNEVDAFNSGREKILLDQAGDYLNNRNDDDEESDEEVLALKNQHPPSDMDEDDFDEDEDEEGEGEDEEGSDEEGWGSKKNYYGGDDVSDDESGKQMAEEALRQQKKHMQELDMDDFVDEDLMDDWKKTAEEHDNQANKDVVVAEEVQDIKNLNNDEKRKFLTGSFPEFIPLAKEFSTLLPTLKELKSQQGAVAQTKYIALAAYLAAISCYFSLFVENLSTKDRFQSMKEEPVMESILTSREVWRQASELVDNGNDKNDESDASGDELEAEEKSESEDVEMPVPEENERIVTDSEEEEESDEESEDDTNPENIDILAKRVIKKAPKNVVSGGDYNETTNPEAVDMEDKQRRKKSLRFYTSKIDQASNKHGKDESQTGDVDLPYRERLFERQQRLQEEARKRGLGMDKDNLGDDLDDQDPDIDEEVAINNINEDGADYYNSIKSSKESKKDARRAAHEKAQKAAKEGKLAELSENIGDDGKRALNFQILKNKGLTPHRKNDNRNARVKKRKKYDAAKKKLKSVRAVYDESNRGPYQGEKTGIKKGLSRSVKF